MVLINLDHLIKASINSFSKKIVELTFDNIELEAVSFSTAEKAEDFIKELNDKMHATMLITGEE